MKLPVRDANEHSPFKKMLNRLAAGGVTLLVLGVVIGSFSLFHLDQVVEQLELKTYDLRTQLHLGYRNKRPSPEVMILQFDDPSLNVLNDEFGVWPWPRDVHARMIHFLNRAGVRSLLYDIMFVSYRKGSEAADQMLVDAFKQYSNVYLSMNFDNELVESQKLGKDLTPQDIERIKPLSIEIHSELGKTRNHLKLKHEPDGTVFFDNDHMTFNHYRSIMPSLLEAGRNIGIINHGPDDDGVSRSNPLFFRFRYHPFLKTPALPLRKHGDTAADAHGHSTEVWHDAEGRHVDRDGYLFMRSSFLPVTQLKDGSFVDQRKQLTDAEGYLLDGYGHYIYQREAKASYMYFPYLGLRAALNLKFPNKTPELLLTADGHLRFEGYDIPLDSDGDFLVNWHNVNVNREEYQKNQRELLAYRDLLEERVRALETGLEQASIGMTERHKWQKEITDRKQELQKVSHMLQMLRDILATNYLPHPYRTVSAWEVIRTMKKEESGLPLGPEDIALKKLLRDKIIFVGATAVAAYDIKNTSIHSSLPGVVLQANLFDNLYQNDGRYLKRVNKNTNLVVTILICLLAAGFTFKNRSALVGMLTTANIAVFYVLFAVVLYQSMDLWINIAMPLVFLIITTTITFMVKYIMRDKDYEKTYALATTDSMTGLYNHRFFQDHMRYSIDQAVRFKHKFSLILIDIDFFKKFNDTYGHQAGDEVLRHVARKLKKSVRNVDIVARYGGEEMAVILERATEEEALAVANKIVKAVAEEAYPIAEGVAKHVTISCGVSTFPTHGETPSALIEFADAGLYRAKDNGRNQVGAQYDQSDAADGGGHSSPEVA